MPLGDRWFVDETYVKVSGRWTCPCWAIDQHGQVIDVLLSMRRDPAAARHFFTRAMRAGVIPVEVMTDRAPAYPRVLDELIPSALHTVERYASNPVEADHGRLKARLRPMRGLKRHRSARILAAGRAFVQNLRRGRYGIATHVPARQQLRTAFDELAVTIWRALRSALQPAQESPNATAPTAAAGMPPAWSGERRTVGT
jgi:transposase-like protein